MSSANSICPVDYSFLGDVRPFLGFEICDEMAVATFLMRAGLLWRQVWAALATGAVGSASLPMDRLKDRWEAVVDLRVAHCMGENVGAERKNALLPVLLECVAAAAKKEKRDHASSALDLLDALSSERMKRWLQAYLTAIPVVHPNFKPSRRVVNEAVVAGLTQQYFVALRERFAAEHGAGAGAGVSANLRVRDLRAAFRESAALWPMLIGHLDPMRLGGAKNNEQAQMIQKLEHAKRFSSLLDRIDTWLPEEAKRWGIKENGGNKDADAAAATPRCIECEGELALNAAGGFASVRCDSGCKVPLHAHCWLGLEGSAEDGQHIPCPRAASGKCASEVRLALLKVGPAITEVLLATSDMAAAQALVGTEESVSGEGVVGEAAGGDEDEHSGSGSPSDEDGGLSLLGQRHQRGVKMSLAHTRGRKLKGLVPGSDGVMDRTERLEREAEQAEKEAKKQEEARRQEAARARREEERRRRSEKEAEEAAAAAAAAALSKARRGAASKLEVAVRGDVSKIAAPVAVVETELMKIQRDLRLNNVRDEDDQYDAPQQYAARTGAGVGAGVGVGGEDDRVRQVKAAIEERKRAAQASLLRGAPAYRPVASSFALPAQWAPSSSHSPPAVEDSGPAFPPLPTSSAAASRGAQSSTPVLAPTPTLSSVSPPLVAMTSAVAASAPEALVARPMRAVSMATPAAAVPVRAEAKQSAPSPVAEEKKQQQYPSPLLLARTEAAAPIAQPMAMKATPAAHPPPPSYNSLASSVAVPVQPQPPAQSAASASPPIVVVDDVATCAPGVESAILLLTNVSPLLTASLIGSLFRSYGRVRLNMLLSVRHGLSALLEYEHVFYARNAFHALNNMMLQIDVTRTVQSHSPGAALQQVTEAPLVFPLHIAFVATAPQGGPDVRLAPQVNIRSVAAPAAFAPAAASFNGSYASVPGGMAV